MEIAIEGMSKNMYYSCTKRWDLMKYNETNVQKKWISSLTYGEGKELVGLYEMSLKNKKH